MLNATRTLRFDDAQEAVDVLTACKAIDIAFYTAVMKKMKDLGQDIYYKPEEGNAEYNIAEHLFMGNLAHYELLEIVAKPYRDAYSLLGISDQKEYYHKYFINDMIKYLHDPSNKGKDDHVKAQLDKLVKMGVIENYNKTI